MLIQVASWQPSILRADGLASNITMLPAGSVAGQIVPSPHCRTVAAEWLSTACNTQSLTLDCTPGKGRHHTSTQARWVGLGQRGDRKTPVTLSQGSRDLGPKSDASELQ